MFKVGSPHLARYSTFTKENQFLFGDVVENVMSLHEGVEIRPLSEFFSEEPSNRRGFQLRFDRNELRRNSRESDVLSMRMDEPIPLLPSVSLIDELNMSVDNADSFEFIRGLSSY